MAATVASSGQGTFHRSVVSSWLVGPGQREPLGQGQQREQRDREQRTGSARRRYARAVSSCALGCVSRSSRARRWTRPARRTRRRSPPPRRAILAPVNRPGSAAGSSTWRNVAPARGVEGPHQLQQLGVDRGEPGQRGDDDREERHQRDHDQLREPARSRARARAAAARIGDRDRLRGDQQRIDSARRSGGEKCIATASANPATAATQRSPAATSSAVTRKLRHSSARSS